MGKCLEFDALQQISHISADHGACSSRFVTERVKVQARDSCAELHVDKTPHCLPSANPVPYNRSPMYSSINSTCSSRSVIARVIQHTRVSGMERSRSCLIW